jgi:predicted MFS family arabinose efflux permease
LPPQPSDSPNDPLNWPKWKKDFVFFILLVGTICSTIHGPLLSPVTVALSIEFNRSINDIAQLSSYMLLIIAVSAYVFAAWANIFGKRGLFIFAMATLVAADAWAATASGYHLLFGARMFSGVGQGAFECLRCQMFRIYTLFINAPSESPCSGSCCKQESTLASPLELK